MKPTIFNIQRVLFTCLLLAMLTGCKKFLEIPPPRTSIVGSVVYSDNASAIAAQDAVFMEMTAINTNSFINYQYRPDFSADEWLFYANSLSYNQLSKNSLTSDNSETRAIWTSSYAGIFSANSVIEGVGSSTGITESVKKQLLAEAKFCRAFRYFYLVNLFGNVPLVTTTDFKTNSALGRAPVNEIYNQITNDLLDAQSNLSEDYLTGDLKQTSQQRLRPNKAVATALLARVYLYREQWGKAEAEASKIISNTQYILEPKLENVFLASSREAIWQLPSSDPTINTNAGLSYIGISIDNTVNASLNPAFLNVFENGDTRKSSWIGIANKGASTYYYPNKYKVYQSSNVSEYEVVLRLAEVYLIRAEARAQLNNVIGTESAQSDLDKVRNRAGLPGTSATSKEEMLMAILHERQTELFAEYGHRWLDLKRTRKIDQVMQAIASAKKGVWDPRQALYPIPAKDILSNRNLLPNNPGY